MDTSELQNKLGQLTQLLPSQRECLDRLLFQLTFNQYQKVRIVGAPGSGKSAIALALAELFSEQFNVAFLDNKTVQNGVNTQLMLQWFNQSFQPDVSLHEQVDAAVSVLPLLLIIDDADKLSTDTLTQLTQLDCLVFSLATAEGEGDDITLLLNKLSLEDARQLLRDEPLNELELTQRLTNAEGNIHLLMQAPLPLEQVADTQQDDVAKRNMLAVYVGIAVVIIGTLWWLFTGTDTADNKQQGHSQPSRETLVPVADVTAKSVIATTEAQDANVTVLTTEHTKSASEDVTEIATVASASDPGDGAAMSTGDIDTENTLAADEMVLPAVNDLNNDAEALTAVTESEQSAVADGFSYDESALLAMDKQAYAVQLAVLSNDAAYQRFKSAYPTLSVLTYSRSWQGQPQLVLLLAAYEDKATARATIASLPTAIKATGPFIKSLQAIHNEINVSHAANTVATTD